ncbi:hypothetical protein BC833DRAFT_622512 [Globomyces pollinis-pini]|nr:hypothetical protein BC833DRAFT_622512 [Globomyces pollinis-pini]
MLKLLALSSSAFALALDGVSHNGLYRSLTMIDSILSIAAGFQLASMMLTLKEGGLIDNPTVYLILTIAFGIAGVVVVHVVEKPSLIAGTALIGSYAMITSLDPLLGTGFLRGEHGPAGVLLMLAGTGLGVAYQYKTTKDLKYRDPQ